MKLFLLFGLLFATLALGADKHGPDNRTVAAHLAKLARKAASSGQTVRAYMLYAEAVARDPQNSTYWVNRDALAPAAKLLTKANIQTADIHKDVLSAEYEAAHPEPPIERISPADWQGDVSLAPPPKIRVESSPRNIDLHADAKSLVQQVAALYGVRAIADAGIEAQKPIHFEIADVDFRAALEAVTAATHTFVFPVSSSLVYFAPDTEAKRNELEPIVVLTFPLQEALTEKDLIDAANAVRGLLNLRTIGWDSSNRRVVIRDRVTRAHVARAIMEALLVPPAQISFDVQFLTTDTDRNYHYGVTLQTLFQFIDFGNLGGLKSVLPAVVSGGPAKFLGFGGGATLFGVGVADAMAFATYSNSVAQTIFNATVVVGDRQTADFHIGDKYPIASSLYSGFQQSGGGESIYQPAPQITMEDLGLILKLTPHINGEGDIDIEVEADYKTLGSQTFNTVPSVAERGFKGTVSLRTGEWAILAGIDTSSHSNTRTGLAGLSQLPGLKQIFSDTTRDLMTSNTLLVIKPTITRLPMIDGVSPQFLLGARRGQRVLI